MLLFLRVLWMDREKVIFWHLRYQILAVFCLVALFRHFV